MSAPRSTRDRARDYLRRGWAPIPVLWQSKNPGFERWQECLLTEADLDTAFPDQPMNVSVLPGPVSDGLGDVDLDVPLAISLAPRFVPDTDAVFGRRSARRSHRLYQLLDEAKSARWRDPTLSQDDDRAMLLEFRFSGHTLFPGSTHPNGEAIDWDEEGEPAVVKADALLFALAQLAAAVLLARYWPTQGSRHEVALALAGGLLRSGWPVDQVTDLISAVVVGADDDEPEDRVRTVISSARAQASGQATTGWPTLSKLIDPRVVTTVIAWLGLRTGTKNSSYEEFTSTQPDLETLARAISVPPFPLEIFPPRVRVYLERGAASVGCPPDLVALPFLGYVASAIGKSRIIRIKSRWQQRATLWTGVVAASGDGKSPADAYARAALDELQSEADERFQEQFGAFKQELTHWKASDPKTRGEEPLPPLYEHWFSTDATVESLAPMLQHNAGLALACDELVAWARGCNSYKKSGNDRQKYLEIWNGRPLKVDRKTQGVIYVKEPVLGIVGGIQPERLHEMTREAGAHDGLLPRFLWTYPDVTPSDWSWDEREVDDLDWMVALFQSLRRSPLPVSPLVLRPDPDARVEWKAWYDETMRGRRSLPPLTREFASKLPAQLARAWLVLATLWHPKDPSGVASATCLRDAILFIEYARAHARRVMVHFGTAAPHVDAGLAARVRAILDRARVGQADHGGWLSRTELWDRLHRNCDAEALDGVLQGLAAVGVAETREVATGTNKRTEWRARMSNSSYEEFDALDDPWVDDEEDVTPAMSNSSHEEFTKQLRQERRRCFACKSTRFSDDGVCLRCHPRLGFAGTGDAR